MRALTISILIIISGCASSNMNARNPANLNDQSIYTVGETREVFKSAVRTYLKNNVSPNCESVRFEVRAKGSYLSQRVEIFQEESSDCEFSFEDIPRNFYILAVGGIDRTIIIDTPGTYKLEDPNLRSPQYFIHPDVGGNISVKSFAREFVFFLPSETNSNYCQTKSASSKELCFPLDQNESVSSYPSGYFFKNLSNLFNSSQEVLLHGELIRREQPPKNVQDVMPTVDEVIDGDLGLLELNLPDDQLQILTSRMALELDPRKNKNTTIESQNRSEKVFCSLLEFYISQPFKTVAYLASNLHAARVNGERIYCDGTGM